MSRRTIKPNIKAWISAIPRDAHPERRAREGLESALRETHHARAARGVRKDGTPIGRR